MLSEKELPALTVRHSRPVHANLRTRDCLYKSSISVASMYPKRAGNDRRCTGNWGVEVPLDGHQYHGRRPCQMRIAYTFNLHQSISVTCGDWPRSSSKTILGNCKYLHQRSHNSLKSINSPYLIICGFRCSHTSSLCFLCTSFVKFERRRCCYFHSPDRHASRHCHTNCNIAWTCTSSARFNYPRTC